MKKEIILALALGASLGAFAQGNTASSPDGSLSVTFTCTAGKAAYSVALNGKEVIAPSPLGLIADIGDFSGNLQQKGFAIDTVRSQYALPTIKKSKVDVKATRALISFWSGGSPALDIECMVENRDIAFRYLLKRRPARQEGDSSFCAMIKSDNTHFNLPQGTTTFLSPQMKGGTGWQRTAPSYELPYSADMPAGSNAGGAGFIFPCLFKTPDAWVLVSETGVSSAYCASRLICEGGCSYKIGNPMESDFNYVGSPAPGIPLPGATPWRTITVGQTLAPIAETTIPWDFVEPLYEPSKAYDYGAGVWSWIIGMDESVHYATQKEYIDFAAQMGYKSVLVDNWWDKQIGRDSLEMLSRYAISKGASLFLWYNSNGYWNDAPQTPRNIMSNLIARRKEMAWMKSIGIRGIKVDFMGSDKQQTMQLYEDIMADANDFGLEVIFHGATLPRGWERMYPNFIASEAVLASENLHFSNEFCQQEAFNATLHPIIRNAVASMDYGGTTFSKYFNTANDSTMWGGRRATSDVFQMAVAMLFQCPLNHLALYPATTTGCEPWKIDFMKKVPTTWDDIRLIDAYPGKYLILARRKGHTWYIAAINAMKEPLKRKIELPMLGCGITLYADDMMLRGSAKEIKASKDKTYQINVPCNGAAIFVGRE